MATKEKNSAEIVDEQQQPVVNREKVKEEREARRLGKLQAKQKLQDKSRNLSNTPDDEKKSDSKKDGAKAAGKPMTSPKVDSNTTDKNSHRKEQTHGKSGNVKETDAINAEKVAEDLDKLKISSDSKQSKSMTFEKPEKKQLTKAERRAIQEQQRAAKAGKTAEKQTPQSSKKESNEPKAGPSGKSKRESTPTKSSNDSNVGRVVIKRPQQHRVKLFNHLYADISAVTILNSPTIHPAIVRLGVQYSGGIVKGCNARGLAFMNAIKSVITEYETPSQKEFSRGLEDVLKTCGSYLQQCRPLAVSVTNAMKFIQFQLRQLPKSESDAEQKTILLESIDTYVKDQIGKAAEAISQKVQEKISDGDVILTFGCSSVILNILIEAKKSKREFRVIVVDARPWHEGKEMLRRLVSKDIKCTCVLINAAGFIMPEVTKVLLRAHALLANGYVMSRAGTAQIALIAKSYNVPVLVCCETHKFSERVQTDAFVYNEIGNPYDVVKTNENNSPLANWESVPNLTPLNLYYDVTPPELVSAVVTEVAILPCTSVPVILRIKPSEIGY